jgi:hypothetical protein
MMKGDHRDLRQLMERVRPLVSAPDMTPLTQIFWHVIEASYEAIIGNGRACYAAVDGGLATARRTGVLGLNHALAMQGVYGALGAGELDVARRYHATAREHLGAEERTNRAHLLSLDAWIALCSGSVPVAEERARAAMADLKESGADVHGWADLGLAHVLVERGEHEEAVELLERALAWARAARSVVTEHEVLLTLAHARISQGQVPEGLEWLRRGMCFGREHDLVSRRWMGWRPDVLARLTALALDHRIEVAHVCRVIEERGLAAPPEAATSEAWPRPVQVRTLGGFELRRDGAPVSFGRKVPRKPLEVLQALAASGGDVRERILADELWPDADGDAARHSLQTAMYRLRRILGSPATIVQGGGEIRLDPRLVWSDAVALQHRLAAGLARLDRTAAGDPSEIRRELEGVLDLYRGPLLPDHDGAWVEHARERLRAQVSRFVGAATRTLESAGERGAAKMAARALDSDPGLSLGTAEAAGA